jgi:hypothetical protein
MLLPIFSALEASPFLTPLRDVGQPLCNVFHLVSLSIFIGAILMVDLRLLGTGVITESVEHLYKQSRPWMVFGLIGLAITGIAQVLLLPLKEYNSDLFWLKMQVLLVAVLFEYFVRSRVARAPAGSFSIGMMKLVGLTSIGLWLGVVIPGRLIGLFN